jgi:hypothetical protein
VHVVDQAGRKQLNVGEIEHWALLPESGSPICLSAGDAQKGNRSHPASPAGAVKPPAGPWVHEIKHDPERPRAVLETPSAA